MLDQSHLLLDFLPHPLGFSSASITAPSPLTFPKCSSFPERSQLSLSSLCTPSVLVRIQPGAEPVGDVCVEGLFQGVGVRDCGAAGAGLLPRAQASGAAGCPPQAGSPLAQGSRSPGVKAFQLMGPGPPDQLGSSSLLKVNGLWALTTSTKHLHSRTLVSP